MFHQKIAANSLGSGPFLAANQDRKTPNTTSRLALVPPGSVPRQESLAERSARFELLTISAKKCSSFLAEAAVLVLVFALLDRLIVKDRMEISWVASAVGISLALLAGSIALDFTARRLLRPR